MPAFSRLFTVLISLVGLGGIHPVPLAAQGLVIQDAAPSAETTTPSATTPPAATTPPSAAPTVTSREGRTIPPGYPTLPEPVSSAPVIAPMQLDIARRDLKNFLTDAEALTPYRHANGPAESLTEVFVIGSNAIPRAVFWDPLACRLLGVLDLAPVAPVPPAPSETESEPNPEPREKNKSPNSQDKPESIPAPLSPYLMMAAGPPPLSGSGGASGSPRYFGFRLVGGMPEFLYTFGALSVEERLWLEDEGNILKQRFSVPEAPRGLLLTFPEEWKLRVTASVGVWKKNVLSVPKEASGEVILTYRLTEVTPEPAESP